MSMEDKEIIVCDECKQASCWYGEFMCDRSQFAATRRVMRSDLEKLNLESPDYWSDEKLLEVYGTTKI